MHTQRRINDSQVSNLRSMFVFQARGSDSVKVPMTYAVDNIFVGAMCPDACGGHGMCQVSPNISLKCILLKLWSALVIILLFSSCKKLPEDLPGKIMLKRGRKTGLTGEAAVT